ncbi:hypothetical protein TNCV_2174201 [Trichonephila clavipes]|nr:hypothetical protein TNCV_2174201 [Trichonephila clavipes]
MTCLPWLDTLTTGLPQPKSDHGRYVMSSRPVPLKTCRVGQRCTLNLSRAQTSPHWCGVVVRRGGAGSGGRFNLDRLTRFDIMIRLPQPVVDGGFGSRMVIGVNIYPAKPSRGLEL